MSGLLGKSKGSTARGSAERLVDGLATGPGNDAVASTASPLPRPTTSRALKLLRFPAVRERTGLSRSTIWRLERVGAFPRHRRISANAVAWLEDDVMAWIESKMRDVAV